MRTGVEQVLGLKVRPGACLVSAGMGVRKEEDILRIRTRRRGGRFFCKRVEVDEMDIQHTASGMLGSESDMRV